MQFLRSTVAYTRVPLLILTNSLACYGIGEHNCPSGRLCFTERFMHMYRRMVGQVERMMRLEVHCKCQLWRGPCLLVFGLHTRETGVAPHPPSRLHPPPTHTRRPLYAPHNSTKTTFHFILILKILARPNEKPRPSHV